MRRKNKTVVALFQIAAFVFLMNTTTAAFSACCFALPENSTAAEKTPCHSAETVNVNEPSDDCCLICVSMISPAPTLKSGVASIPETNSDPITSLLSSGIDPPFRPPITLFS